ncbi:WD40/YVTN/BNR-like repeat-containing protein [Pseudomonas moorei]|uniref:WD40/YVTN/BNR-like repeat-containing protein n=1 Tax=Pseudomonas moorei TaxID=395599 RepID=UPI00200EEA61|nr:YCF48-related protein [Pseudomonas moorei]
MYSLKLLALALALVAGHCVAAPPVDVLDQPAQSSKLADRSPLLDLAQAGKRLIAVGQRGHILYSDDQGIHWTQARVPVSTDLNAVQFATEQQGWAVGHDGVVLHSRDGGSSWEKQLDGRQLGRLMQQYYSARSESEQWQELSKRIETEGADKPFLDLWFSDELNGFVVGAFNLIFRTRDGGKSWEPWADRIDNPSGYHLNAIADDGKHLFIAGEQGLLVRLADNGERFQALTTPYEGSFFGLSAQPGMLLAYGLRGHVYRSKDEGLSWTKVPTGLNSSITASASDRHGQLYLFAQTGQVLASKDQGEHFQSLDLGPSAPIYGAMLAEQNRLLLVGPRGISQRLLVPVQQEDKRGAPHG